MNPANACPTFLACHPLLGRILWTVWTTGTTRTPKCIVGRLHELWTYPPGFWQPCRRVPGGMPALNDANSASENLRVRTMMPTWNSTNLTSTRGDVNFPVGDPCRPMARRIRCGGGGRSCTAPLSTKAFWDTRPLASCAHGQQFHTNVNKVYLHIASLRDRLVIKPTNVLELMRIARV